MKLTKDLLKNIINEIVSGPAYSSAGGARPAGSNANYLYPGDGTQRQFTTGERPDNSNNTRYEGRAPYETLGVKTHIEDGEVLLVIGKTKYKLMFDDEELQTGRVVPLGEYKFTINKMGLDSNVEWISEVPPNIKFDAQLEKQILDFSGREVKDE